jgi:hypothetical protein
LHLARVDWFKTDSQGTDLRLVASLGENLLGRVLAVDVEPGILDAYRGEDKLADVLQFMDRQRFWLCQMTARGSVRLKPEYLAELGGLYRRLLSHAVPVAPGWAEMTFLNSFPAGAALTLREWLLGWVIATLHKQHGFALDLAVRGLRQFGDALFEELARYSRSRLRVWTVAVPFLAAHQAWQMLRHRLRR